MGGHRGTANRLREVRGAAERSQDWGWANAVRARTMGPWAVRFLKAFSTAHR